MGVGGWRGLGRSWWATLRAASRPPVTVAWPAEREEPVSTARGSIAIDSRKCDDSQACVRACPTGCLQATAAGLRLDRAACISCGLCVEACPTGAVSWSAVDELAATTPDGLVVDVERADPPRAPTADPA